MYRFARHPDLAVYFDVPLETALNRILDGRPALKYHEAGLDLGLSKDAYESFRLFQGRIYEEYNRITGEYPFIKIDASLPSEVQQAQLRDYVRRLIDLKAFKRRRQEVQA
jgi:dTMP kinase